MNTENFIKCIRDEAIKNGITDTVKQIESEEFSEDIIFQKLRDIYKSQDSVGKMAIKQALYYCLVDATSTVLGIIDGSTSTSYPDDVEFELKVSVEKKEGEIGEMKNLDDIQSEFLAMEEEEKWKEQFLGI